MHEPPPRSDDEDAANDAPYPVSPAAGSLLRRVQRERPEPNEPPESPDAQPENDVPLTPAERKLMEQLAARRQALQRRMDGPHLLGTQHSAPPPPPRDEDSALYFPDLPPDLIPQRADGTGVLTYRDINEMEKRGTTPLLTKIAARQAAIAAQHLQHKMALVAAEFSEGLINHAQFEAIYTRYAEQRALIERIRSTDPRSTAWQVGMTASGDTGYLRQQYAAHIVGAVLVDNHRGSFIRQLGSFNLEQELLIPILRSLAQPRLRASELRERSTQIEGNRWLSIVPGDYTTTIALYTQEPSAAQRTLLADLHRDFERANHRVLKLGSYRPERLVYPQRMLFENE